MQLTSLQMCSWSIYLCFDEFENCLTPSRWVNRTSTNWVQNRREEREVGEEAFPKTICSRPSMPSYIALYFQPSVCLIILPTYITQLFSAFHWPVDVWVEEDEQCQPLLVMSTMSELRVPLLRSFCLGLQWLTHNLLNKRGKIETAPEFI